MYSCTAYYMILCLPIGVVFAVRSINLESTQDQVFFQFHINWLSDSKTTPSLVHRSPREDSSRCRVDRNRLHGEGVATRHNEASPQFRRSAATAFPKHMQTEAKKPHIHTQSNTKECVCDFAMPPYHINTPRQGSRHPEKEPQGPPRNE
jgi:hypothetical protein